MSQHFFKDKAVERYDLQKSRLLKTFGCQDRMNNFGANYQPEYSYQRKTMLLASTAEFTTRMCKKLGYLPEIAEYWIGVRWNKRYLHNTSTRSLGIPNHQSLQQALKLST